MDRQLSRRIEWIAQMLDFEGELGNAVDETPQERRVQLLSPPWPECYWQMSGFHCPECLQLSMDTLSNSHCPCLGAHESHMYQKIVLRMPSLQEKTRMVLSHLLPE